eukprot:scaffold3437_cov113-Cylindrotheca_fusiformis.AAC.6
MPQIVSRTKGHSWRTGLGSHVCILAAMNDQGCSGRMKHVIRHTGLKVYLHPFLEHVMRLTALYSDRWPSISLKPC